MLDQIENIFVLNCILVYHISWLQLNLYTCPLNLQTIFFFISLDWKRPQMSRFLVYAKLLKKKMRKKMKLWTKDNHERICHQNNFLCDCVQRMYAIYMFGQFSWTMKINWKNFLPLNKLHIYISKQFCLCWQMIFFLLFHRIHSPKCVDTVCVCVYVICFFLFFNFNNFILNRTCNHFHFTSNR